MHVLLLAVGLLFAKEGGHNLDLFPTKAAEKAKATPPAAVELISPAFRSQVKAPIELTWKDSATATHYHVQVATDPNFKWLLTEDKNVHGTKFVFSGAEVGKSYFWRVWAVNSQNDAGFTKSSSVFSQFSVQ